MTYVVYIRKGRRRPASWSRGVTYHLPPAVLGKDYMPFTHSVERWQV